MSADIVVRRWIADGAAVILRLGFKPEYVKLFVNVATGQTPDMYEFFDYMEDESTAIYGIITTGSTGATSVATTAATGISAYNSTGNFIKVASPDGSGYDYSPIEVWTTSYDPSGAAYSARTATAAGSFVWPPTRNGYVYEVATATGAGTSAPSSWSTTLGGTTTDGGSNVFTTRQESSVIRGCQGITIGASIQTDSQINYCICYKPTQFRNLGDVVNIPASGFAGDSP